MAKFELEPGERVLARGGVPWKSGQFPLALIPLLVGLAKLPDIVATPALDEVARIVDVIAVVFLVLVLPMLIIGTLLQTYDRWLLTDRRIAVWSGLRGRRHEMRLESVYSAGYRDGRFVARAPEETLVIRNALIPADALSRIFGRWFPEPGRPAARLGRIVQPGESVLIRSPSRMSWRISVPVLLFFMGGLGAWEVATIIADGTLSTRDFQDAVPTLLMVFLGLMLLRLFDWRYAVTDRRLLRRLEHDPARFEEIPLSRVKVVPQGAFPDKLWLRVDDEEAQIPFAADIEAAARIRDAIARAKEAAR